MEYHLEEMMRITMVHVSHFMQKALWNESAVVDGSRAMWEEILTHRLMENVVAFQPGRN